MFKRARWMVLGYGARCGHVVPRGRAGCAGPRRRYTPNEVANRVGATVGGTAARAERDVRGTRHDARPRGELRSTHHLDRGARAPPIRAT